MGLDKEYASKWRSGTGLARLSPCREQYPGTGCPAGMLLSSPTSGLPEQL
jgi:hypothetical protein